MKAPRAALLAVSIVLLAAVGAPANATSGAVLSEARSVRFAGCEGHPGVRSALASDSMLDAAANRWANGEALANAIARAGYREEQSFAVHVSGPPNALRGALERGLCRALTDARVRDLGSTRRGRDLWIIAATPFLSPPRQPGALAHELLSRINAARAQARRCGGRSFAPAPPLRLDTRLGEAAARHAEDMLAHDFFDHRGSDGSSPATRVAAAGYRYALVGENIASGPQSAAEAVAGWLASPGHCENIMDRRFVDTAFAVAANRRGEPRIYWVEEFATPP